MSSLFLNNKFIHNVFKFQLAIHSFSTFSLDLYCVFITPIAKKPASQKYDVAYGINTRKTLVQVSGYSCFTKVQNSGRDDGENFSLYVEF